VYLSVAGGRQVWHGFSLRLLLAKLPWAMRLCLALAPKAGVTGCLFAFPPPLASSCFFLFLPIPQPGNPVRTPLDGRAIAPPLSSLLCPTLRSGSPTNLIPHDLRLSPGGRVSPLPIFGTDAFFRPDFFLKVHLPALRQRARSLCRPGSGAASAGVLLLSPLLRD